jgi:hypothetical protein
LITAMLALQTPFAEVLAVVTQQAITVFANTGPRTLYHVRVAEPSPLVRSYQDGTSTGEASERNLLHRPPERVTFKGSVANDLSVTNINAVVSEAEARCEEVRAQCRSNTASQEVEVVRASGTSGHCEASTDPASMVIPIGAPITSSMLIRVCARLR